MPVFKLFNPERKSVVIFDYEGSEAIGKMALGDIDYGILHSRGELVYVTPQILGRMAVNMKYFRRMRFGAPMDWYHPSKLLRQFAGRLYRIYLLSCVQYMRPKVVITFIDNSYAFQLISRIYNKAKFIAVQNGIRRRWNLKDSLAPVPLPGSIISMPMLVCFGQYDVELFKRCHHQIDYYHPLGALKAGYYKSVLSKRNGVYEFDVCLISEWDEAIASGGFLPAFGKGLTVMNGFLSRYLKEEKRTGCVALRSNNKKEKDYFLSQLGGQMTLVDNNSNELTSYNTVDRSRVSISLVSTLAYEAFGWGARVLFCNFTGDDQYDFPSPGIWSTSEGHYESFKAKLDLLMTVSQEEYRWKTKEAAAYVMNNTTAIPPHEFIRKLVLEQIEAP